MPLETRLSVGLAVALAVVYVTTPLAIRLADRLEFYDRPVGYKGHAGPTPYLGGAAVVAGFVASVVLLTGEWRRTVPLVAGVLVLWAVGTLDDRRTVRPLWRVGVEVALAAGLWALGLGWHLGAGEAVDLAVTAFWLVAIVNAFNLFDNMDGATSSVAAVASAGLGLLGVVVGDPWLAVCGAALCGACIGFLPHNLLASPARIFLGDGGSMPVGFAIAALAMEGLRGAAPAWQSLAMGLLFVGIPALDTVLVIVSRRRRGLSVLTAGRDHLTHRIRQRVGTARAVAITLGSAQATVSVLAVVAVHGVPPLVVPVVLGYLVAAGVGIAVLETSGAPEQPRPAHAPAAPRPGPRTSWTAPAPLVATGVALGVSPFFFGYYDPVVWVPAGLGLVMIATAGTIARPPRLTAPAWLLLAGLAGLAVASLASAAWTESIERAVVDANRWMAYLALTGTLLVLVRSRRAALWLLGSIAAVALAVAGVVIARMLGGAGDAFLAGRLHEPLGYINGQGSFFVLALWPLLALAEHSRSRVAAAAGMAGAVLLAALALLSQSRGVALAACAAAVVVLVALPGRRRRIWALLVLVGALLIAAPALVDVYRHGRDGALPDAVVRDAARMSLIAAALAGMLWSALRAVGSAPLMRRASAAALVGLATLGLALGLANAGRIADSLDRQYTSFVRLDAGVPSADGTATRLVSGAGNRYEYWSVAWRTWRDHPVRGVGAGNFDQAWFAERSIAEDIRQPHSVQLQILSELGLIGFACLLLVLAGLAWGVARAARAAGTSPADAGLALAGAGIVTAWLVHTSVDWMHLLPGLTGVALAAGVALLQGRVAALPATGSARPRRGRTIVPAVAVGVMLAVAAVSLARQGLADHFRREAEGALARDPATALREIDRSLRLDAEAVRSYYVKAAALARFDDGAAARGVLLAAASREPRNFLTWALLGDLSVRMGEREQARRYYRRAARLNPREPSLHGLARDPEQR